MMQEVKVLMVLLEDNILLPNDLCELPDMVNCESYCINVNVKNTKHILGGMSLSLVRLYQIVHLEDNRSISIND